MIDEALESPAFWILGGGGVMAILGGYIFGKRAGLEVMPMWMVITMILVTLMASAYFSTRG